MRMSTIFTIDFSYRTIYYQVDGNQRDLYKLEFRRNIII